MGESDSLTACRSTRVALLAVVAAATQESAAAALRLVASVGEVARREVAQGVMAAAPK
jgi:hypothetical protein